MPRTWLINPVAVLFVLFFCVMGSSLHAQEDAEGYSDTVTVVEGQTRLMRYRGVMRVSIGHPDIANAQATGPDEILLTGLKAGVTDLRVWTESGRQQRYLLRVVDTSWVQILEIVNIILADVEGVTAREDNGIVFVEGRVLRDHDLKLINELRDKLKTEIEAGRVVFNVASPTVSLQAMVLMDVQVVEVRRSDLMNLGIRWDAFTDGPSMFLVEGTQGLQESSGTVTRIKGNASGFGLPIQYGSILNLLQSEGIVRVLAQPKLVSKSGTKAEFLAGGEVPIPIITNDRLQVEYKQIGVILEISPVADPDGFISTKIEVEVSDIDPSITVRDFPGFTTNRTIMELNVQHGQTMVISGMLKADDSRVIERVPGIGRIPIIGELFRSRDFNQGTTELVIFVTPYIVNPESQWNKDMLEYTRDLSNNAAREVRGWALFD